MFSNVYNYNGNGGATGYPVCRNLSLVRGDSFVLTVLVKLDGKAGMIGEGLIYFAVYSEGKKSVINKSFSSACQDKNGVVSLLLLPDETAQIEPGSYAYEVEFRFSDEFVITVVNGVLKVHEDFITQEVRNESGNYC